MPTEEFSPRTDIYISWADKFLAIPWTQTLDCPVYSLVTVLTEICHHGVPKLKLVKIYVVEKSVQIS